MIFVLSFITGLFLSAGITPFVIKLAKKFSLVDNKKKRKKTTQVHKGTIPRAGGLALGISFIITSLIFVPLNKASAGILVASFTAVLVGIIDDIKETSPYSRFISNIFIAGIIVVSGVGIPFITNPFNGVFDLTKYTWEVSISNPFSQEAAFQFSILYLAHLFAIFWIVWLMNIVGWSGGVDGQLPGLVSIAAVVIGILSFRFSAHDISQVYVAIFAFITAGVYAGFLPWNFYPQKIMPGYSGKSLAGLLLAVLSILSGAKVGTAILVLLIPTIDALFTIIRRIMQGKSPFYADMQHLHHKLLQRGWGKRKIAVFYWLTTALFGVISLNLTTSLGKFFAVSSIALAILILLTILHFPFKSLFF